MYFASDGSYGDAADIVVVDVTNWTEDDFSGDDGVDNVTDLLRAQTAVKISKLRDGFLPESEEDIRKALEQKDLLTAFFERRKDQDPPFLLRLPKRFSGKKENRGE